jgi:hypothetical protein
MTTENSPKVNAPPADAPEQQQLDFSAIAKVAQRIRLSNVRLRWSQLGLFGIDDPNDPEWGSKAFLSFDSRAAFDEEEAPEPGEDLLVQCLFQLRYFADLDAKTDIDPEFDEDNPPDVAIEAVFDLSYDIEDWSDISSSDVQQFALANGTHNAWPYWREYAQTTVARLGLEPYVVGPFKLPSRHDPE